MPLLLALLLALDQRVELQLPLLLLAAVVAWFRSPRPVDSPALAATRKVLLAAAAYLLLNSVVTHVDQVGVTETWWQAPVRVWLFYLSLGALAFLIEARHMDREDLFRTLEWLLLVKLVIIAFEGAIVLQTGEPRDRPLFNIILAPDSLLGVRFTSSYDVLFALLALSRQKQLLRLVLLAAVVVLTETRALMFLAAALLAWRLARDGSLASVAAGILVPAIAAVGLVAYVGSESDTAPRLAQIEGSSLDDKIEQIDTVESRWMGPHLLTGRGLGVSLPGIIRDEQRPYSYEAQTPVLLWQGGLMFFALHVWALWLFARRSPTIPIVLVLLLGFLNPTLFGLASAFLVIAFGPLANTAHETPHPRPAVHA